MGRNVWSAVIVGVAATALGGCTCSGDVPPPVVDTPEAPDAPEAAPSTPAGDAPNVLVIVWDTTRADRLSLYGYERETTPELDAFAQDAVVYERAVSPGMWTLPSHAAIFTGLPVSAHGANANNKWLDSRFVTFAEHFGDAGWDTFLFSANPYLQDHTNLTQGFGTTEYPWSKKWKKKSRQATMGKLIDRDASNFLGPKWKKTKYKTGRSADREKDAGLVAAEATMAWIDERSEPSRPWLAVVNYMETHVPRIPSLQSRQALFDEATIEAQLSLDQSFGYLLAYTAGLHEYTDDELEIISSTYDASLRDLDAVTGALFSGLADRGVLDDTIVVLTADHGEHLGEHHRIGHKYSVYNPLVRVPLVVRYPKALKPARVSQIVSNLSIYATLTELAGLDMPEGTHSQSLLDLSAHPAEAYSELVASTPMALKRMSEVHKDFDWSPYLHTYASVEAPDAKCVWRSDGHLELYDMGADVLEAHDLAPSRADEADALCGHIEEWRATFDAFDPDDATPDEGPRDKFSPSICAKLEALGYHEGGCDDVRGSGEDDE